MQNVNEEWMMNIHESLPPTARRRRNNSFFMHSAFAHLFIVLLSFVCECVCVCVVVFVKSEYIKCNGRWIIIYYTPHKNTQLAANTKLSVDLDSFLTTCISDRVQCQPNYVYTYYMWREANAMKYKLYILRCDHNDIWEIQFSCERTRK